MAKTKPKRTPKTVLRLPDLEQSKSAVLNSLTSQSSRRSYDHAKREFIEWYCSDPRLAFNKTVVTRYRIFLEQTDYASSTVNLRLAAVRRLAYEAADAGLLSPDLAAGIRRVKRAKKFGVRVGNWLTAEQGRRLLGAFDRQTLRGVRDYAMVAVLLGCGLRRAEVAALSVQDLQQREEHWVFADLIGKGGRVRTVPVPFWIAAALHTWMAESGITNGTIFRAINKAGRIAAHGFSPKVIWSVVKQACQACNLGNVAARDLRRTCARLCHERGGELEQIQFWLGTSVSRRRSAIWDANSGSAMPSTIQSGSGQGRFKADAGRCPRSNPGDFWRVRTPFQLPLPGGRVSPYANSCLAVYSGAYITPVGPALNDDLLIVKDRVRIRSPYVRRAE